MVIMRYGYDDDSDDEFIISLSVTSLGMHLTLNTIMTVIVFDNIFITYAIIDIIARNRIITIINTPSSSTSWSSSLPL